MKRMSHNEKIMRLLQDGRPHSMLEVYRLGTVAHSRISDLRKKGHTIDCWREGDNYYYQLRKAA